MNSKKFLAILLSVTAMLFLSVLATTQEAQTQINGVSGRATGVNANVSIWGGVSVNTTIAQTAALPAAGGSGGVFTRQVASGTVGVGVNNFLFTGAIDSRTSGGALAGTPNSSQSQSGVDFLSASLLGNTITADFVRANSMCTCSITGTPSCTGGTVITSLFVNGVLINAATTTSVSLLGGVGTIFINEQMGTAVGQNRGITVNALRINLTDGNLAGTNIIISQAHSDITCAMVAATPTPTPVASPTPTPTPQTCTPSTTVTEGDLFPGGLASFGVASGPGSVTIDHVNAGTGTQSITVVGVPINAVVNIPPFVPGTFNPVVVTFTTPNPALPTDFTLRASSQFHGIFIRVRCGTVTPTPTPVATPTPTPTPVASPTPTPVATPTPTPPPSCPTFTSTVPITIPAGAPGTTTGPASPYPSTINVAGLSGTVTKVTVTLNGLTHTFPDDVDVLLVGPGGSVILMSDTGGSLDVTNVNLTFDDASPMLPDATQIVSGTFQPTNFGAGDIFPAPAPVGPYGALLSVFNGSNPNGAWSLYVVDDLGGDVGSLGGFTLRIRTTTTPNCTFPTTN